MCAVSLPQTVHAEYGDNAYAFMKQLQSNYPYRQVNSSNGMLSGAEEWLKSQIVTMGYEYMANAGGVYAQPFHLFLQPIVIITGIYHNSDVPFTIKEYVCHPFAHACRIFVYPACVERLEYLFAAVHAAHGTF